jgi:hypothetical protein
MTLKEDRDLWVWRFLGTLRVLEALKLVVTADADVELWRGDFIRSVEIISTIREHLPRDYVEPSVHQELKH